MFKIHKVALGHQIVGLQAHNNHHFAMTRNNFLETLDGASMLLNHCFMHMYAYNFCFHWEAHFTA
jgi:hypothetical protein